MFNIYRDHSFSLASAYVGAGLGLSINTADATQGGSSLFTEETSTNFAWSLGAGVVKNIASNYDLELGYRYVDLGAADTNKSEFAPNDEQFKGYLDTHEITAGLRYNF